MQYLYILFSIEREILITTFIIHTFNHYRYEGHLKQSIFSIGAREVAEKDVDLVKEVIESTFNDVIK